MTVDGLVALATVDYNDVVESLEQLCGAPSSIGAPECTSLLSMVLMTILCCLVSASFTYMYIHSKA